MGIFQYDWYEGYIRAIDLYAFCLYEEIINLEVIAPIATEDKGM